MRGTNTGCSNSGTIKGKGMVGERDYPIYTAGVSVRPEKISSCYNTGKVSVENLTNGDVFAAGVAAAPESQSASTKCYNTGAVSIKQQGGKFYCGGVFAEEDQISQCYNTGKVSANTKGKVGGVAGLSDYMNKWTVIHCYNTGKVTGKKGSIFVGGILGSYDNGAVNQIGKYFVYDNYSTISPLYGNAQFSWEPYWARGTKVSSISTKSCPKLSSKYWTYSSKHKRLILKNNKEK